jgi:hypothetical protein
MAQTTTPFTGGTLKQMPDSALQLRNSFENTNQTLSISDVTHVVVTFSEDQVRAMMEAIGVEYEASFPQPTWDCITLAASESLFDGQALLQTNTLGSKSIGKNVCVKILRLKRYLLKPSMAPS